MLEHNTTIRKKDGGFQVIVSYKEGKKWKQKSKQGFNKMSDAKKYGHFIVEKLIDQGISSVDSNIIDITVKELESLYIEDRSRELRYNTIQRFSSTFNSFKDLDDIKVIELNYEDVKSAVDKMRSNGLKDTTINIYLAVMATMFSYAEIHYNLKVQNYFKQLKVKVKSNKIVQKNMQTGDVTVYKDVKTVSEKEFQLLCKDLLNSKKEIYAYMHCVCNIAYYCGLRIGEIIGLYVKDIDFKTGFIKVNKQYSKTKNGYSIADLKSNNSYRKVPMPSKLIIVLKEFLEKYIFTSEQYINGMEMVFVKYSVSIMSGSLFLAIKKTLPNTSVHNFRHTYATNLIKNNIDIQTVAGLLGDNVNTVLSTYVHYTEEMEQKAKNTIDKIF